MRKEPVKRELLQYFLATFHREFPQLIFNTCIPKAYHMATHVGFGKLNLSLLNIQYYLENESLHILQ